MKSMFYTRKVNKMKKEYIAFIKYNGMFEGYIFIRKNGSTSSNNPKELATLFTLKQVQKFCFDKNKEFKNNYSYGYVCGYELA
jgi:hypothetical protein